MFWGRVDCGIWLVVYVFKVGIDLGFVFLKLKFELIWVCFFEVKVWKDLGFVF